MNERAIKLRDAFGVGREIPLNYVERPEVDGKFIESLTRDKHVVIYRSSKQGKTTLRKHCLEETDYIVISCLNSMSLDDLHGAILKAAGYRIEQTKTKTVGGKWKYGAEFKGEGNVPFLAKAQTQESYRETGADVDAHELVKEIVDEQAGRYGAFITNFSEGFQETGYEMYKWLAYVVVVSDIEELERGLRRSQVSALIKKAHPMAEKLNEGNITQALQNAASLQVLKSIRPIIFDYDQTTRVLNVVDRSFLIWLAHQDRDELLGELGISADGINAARVPPENLLL